MNKSFDIIIVNGKYILKKLAWLKLRNNFVFNVTDANKRIIFYYNLGFLKHIDEV